jgi:hypothetical protein
MLEGLFISITESCKKRVHGIQPLATGGQIATEILGTGIKALKMMIFLTVGASGKRELISRWRYAFGVLKSGI